MSMLRVVAPYDPTGAAEAVLRMRVKTFRLLSQPANIRLLRDIAQILLKYETLPGDQLYKLLLKDKCSAAHPDDPDIRCWKYPHPYGHHLDLDMESGQITSQWRGLRRPAHRERVTQLPGNLKRMRAINDGGPGPMLTKAWRPVLQACSHLPIDETELLGESSLYASLRAAATGDHAP
jgi:hypothetical protein